MSTQIGSLVCYRERDWVVMPSEDARIVRLHRGDARFAFDDALAEALRGAPTHTETALAAAFLIYRYEWFTPDLADALLDALPYENAEWDWSVTRALQKIAQTQPHLLPARRLPFRQVLESPRVRTFIQTQPAWQRILLFLCGGINAAGRVDPLAVYCQPALASVLQVALEQQVMPQDLRARFQQIWNDPQSTPE
jgi:hypothetical protein